jgi:uridine phosphorylase
LSGDLWRNFVHFPYIFTESSMQTTCVTAWLSTIKQTKLSVHAGANATAASRSCIFNYSTGVVVSQNVFFQIRKKYYNNVKTHEAICCAVGFFTALEL